MQHHRDILEKEGKNKNSWNLGLSIENCTDRQSNCILWTIAVIVSWMANGKFLLWQNEYNFA